MRRGGIISELLRVALLSCLCRSVERLSKRCYSSIILIILKCIIDLTISNFFKVDGKIEFELNKCVDNLE